MAWCCHWNLNTFVKICFNLFCYMTNHLITGPLGNCEFCFPLISMFPLTNIEILGKQNVVGFLQHFELESPSNCKVNSCDCTDEQWFCYKLLWWVLGLIFMKNHESQSKTNESQSESQWVLYLNWSQFFNSKAVYVSQVQVSAVLSDGHLMRHA